MTHQFVEINKKTQFRGSTMTPEKEGVKVVCVLCGQVKIAWDNGEIDTLIHGNAETCNTQS